MRTIAILKPTALLIVLSFLVGCTSVSPTYLDSTVSTSIAGTHVVSVEHGAVSSIAIDVSAESQPILRTDVAAWGWAGWMIERVY